MSISSLPSHTNLAKDQIEKDKKLLGREPFYIFLTSKELVASYYWTGAALEFICQTRFSSRLEKSRRLKEEAGRRQSGKEMHKQAVSEKHAEENVAMADLFRLHLNDFKKAISNRKLPEVYRSNLKIFCDQSNRDSIQSALKSQSSESIDYISVNILGNLDSFDPTENSSKQKVISKLSVNVSD